MNQTQGYTTNYLIPSGGQTQYVNYEGVFSAIPTPIDWRNFSVNNQPFQPQGAFIDNTQGTGDLVINIQPINFSVTVPAATSASVQFPAPANQTMSVTGSGQASLVFVNFPVLPNAGQVNIGNIPSVIIDGIASGVTIPVALAATAPGGAPYQVQQIPFVPVGNTQALNVGTANGSIMLAAGTTSARLVNDGAQPIFVNFGGAAVIPVPGTPAAGFCMLPNTVETFTVAGGTTVNAITASGNSSLYVTGGNGA